MNAHWEIVRQDGLPERPPADQVRLVAAQTDPQIADPEENVRIAVSAAEAAHEVGAQLIVFPECSLTGYCFSERDEALDGALQWGNPLFRDLSEASARLSLRFVVGYLERAGLELANAATLIGPNGIEAHYRKTHLPHLGADRWVTPGCDLSVHESVGLKVGLLICSRPRRPMSTGSSTPCRTGMKR